MIINIKTNGQDNGPIDPGTGGVLNISSTGRPSIIPNGAVSGAVVFSASAGVAPTATPQATGQFAVNSATNELWFSPNGSTWQGLITL